MITYEMQLKDALNLFRKIPFMVEEFNEIKGLDSEFRDSSGTISPLLSRVPMNTSVPSPDEGVEGSALIEVSLATIPYYSYSSPLYSETRDPAILDVPRNMTNIFWNILFRDAFATETNSILNIIHNKLKYVNLSEEHILNRGLFKKLITFGVDSWSSYTNIPLTLQEEEDDEETLDDVISQKLASIYNLLDYSPPQSSLIEDWISSLYLSGQIDYDMKLREENLFKIQDLKSELLRRKFAGSTSLYKILSSSINRSGTFAPVLPLFSVTNEGDFQDNRVIRALDMPGITTRTDIIGIDPLTTYGGVIPQRIIYPLYYTSAGYNADAFEADTISYLRSNKAVFAWDNIKGINDASLVKNTYARLDDPNSPSDPTLISLIHLDTATPIYLDDATSFYDLSTISGSFFDLQADQVLYHRNSLQEELGQDYPFVTYTISGNSSLSLMDFPWLDFMTAALDKKTRVQEQVDIGVQVSQFINTSGNIVTENFVVITFSEDFTNSITLQDSHYEPAVHKYAYLWNLGIHYDVSTFVCNTVTTDLITYMLLQVDESTILATADEKAILEAHPSYEVFTKNTVGLIPFTYKNLTRTDIFNMKMFLGENELGNYEIIDDLYEEEYIKATFLFTPHENVAIAKKYLRRTPTDLTVVQAGNITADWFVKPQEDASLKHIIYGVSRYNEDLNKDEWFWSEPVRVYPLELFEGYTGKLYHPDWMNLVAYVNPYLNVTEKSASPLRKKPSLFRALKPLTNDSPAEDPSIIDANLVGPSYSARLMNLNLDRGYNIYTSQMGDTSSFRGSYFYRNLPTERPYDIDYSHESYLEDETLQIWGDNRPIWETDPTRAPYTYDPADNWDANYIRSQWIYDDQGLAALTFKPGSVYDLGQQHISYYDIRPSKNSVDSGSWHEWVWNDTPNTGMTACVDLMLYDSPTENGGGTAIGKEDYYLLSRNNPPGTIGTNDVYAEFDFYVDRTSTAGELSAVMNVYPLGRTTDLTFTCILGPEGNSPAIFMNQQTQLACSYLYEAGELYNTFETLNITQTIVVDRRWHSIYRVVVKNTTNSIYQIYETESDFVITGNPLATTVSITYTPYITVGVDVDTPYFFGQLIKDKGGTNNYLEGINVFNRLYGYNPTLGNLYDLRLFNRGMHELETIVVCAGSRRELYSYSPSIYKLQYQYFTDLGIFKMRVPSLPEGDNKSIGRVRIFSRSVWDSILTDMYPVSTEEIESVADWEDPLSDTDIYINAGGTYELKSGVVEQLLVPHYETEHSIAFAPGQQIYYKNMAVPVDNGTYSFVQTSLYPIDYQNKFFDSSFILKKDENASTETVYSYKAYFNDELDVSVPTGASAGTLPSAPAGESLIYKADLDLNFEIADTIDLGAPFARGNKIVTSLREETMSITHAAGNTSRKTSDNLVIVPFYIPDQTTAFTSTWAPRLFKFSMGKATLSPNLIRMLNATSYYNELQIPIPYDDNGVVRYTSRWDAIRVMKEGAYYFTCKYPFQITAFDNATSSRISRYPTLYASIRFKIVVTGEPVYYNETIEGTPGKWMHDSLKDVLSNNLYTSTNNLDFPHRRIKIDLYYMDTDSIDSASMWKWKKIASNYDVSVQAIDQESLSKSFSLTSNITAFFSSTYQTPFFDKGGNFDVLKIAVTNGEEILTATTAGNPIISLRMGASYRMLFDYTGQVTELKYNPDVHTIGASFIDAAELESYNHSVDFNVSNNEIEFKKASYSSTFDWSAGTNDYDLTSTTTGFYINGTGAFADINTNYVGNNLSMGNPYSQATQGNLLLSKFSNRREDINSLGYFPYRVENNAIAMLVAPRPFGAPPLRKLPELCRFSGNLLIVSPSSPIDEYAIITAHHQKCMSAVRTAINKLKSSPLGIFEALSTLTPRGTAISYNTSEPVEDITHTFLAYSVVGKELLTSSEIQVTRTTPLGQNLIISNDYSLKDYFEATNGSYEYNTTLDKDVWSLQLGTDAEFTFTYSEPASTTSEVRIRLKTSANVNVKLRFKGPNNSFTLETASQALTALGGWTYLTFNVNDNRQATILSVVFTNATGNLVGQEVWVDSFELRQSFSKVYNMGLAEFYTLGNSIVGSEAVLIPAFNAICFKRKSTLGYFPIQVLNTPAYLSREDSAGIASSFIENNRVPVKSVGDETLLFKPWKRRLKFSQLEPEKTALYTFVYEKKNENNREERISSNPVATGGIFEVYVDSVNFVPPTSLEIGGMNGEHGLIFRPGKFSSTYKFALNINSTTPFSITHEKFSMVANCINYENYKRGVSSPVSITNIQLISASTENPTILYEIEYLPIIYDELRHHFSINLLLRE